MSAPKVFLITALAAFSLVAAVSFWKRGKNASDDMPSQRLPQQSSQTASDQINIAASLDTGVKANKSSAHSDFPSIDRMYQLFSFSQTKLPIVETLSYSSTVSWLKGRPAWIADYAAYYGTSRHFIARSMHGKPDYFNQTVASGSKFNVFRRDKNIQFHLLVDITLRKMALYYYDIDTKERVMLKTYVVGVGRIDPSRPSGSLTPLGTYTLGDKVAIYSPGVTGFFQDQKTEMIRIFGTRWIPFGMALEGATEPAKGYGIHGAPWGVDAKSGSLIENKDCIGKYESDGCIRLKLEDMEELFSVVITKPTFVHIVKNFSESSLPGVEVAVPTR